MCFTRNIHETLTENKPVYLYFDVGVHSYHSGTDHIEKYAVVERAYNAWYNSDLTYVEIANVALMQPGNFTLYFDSCAIANPSDTICSFAWYDVQTNNVDHYLTSTHDFLPISTFPCEHVANGANGIMIGSISNVAQLLNILAHGGRNPLTGQQLIHASLTYRT